MSEIKVVRVGTVGPPGPIKRKIIPAAEALSAGDWINIFNDSGTLKARKAIASGRPADGYVNASFTAGENAAVYLSGINTNVTGMTTGSNVFLSEIPGSGSHTPPYGSGLIVQRLGKALSATEVNLEPGEVIILG